MVRGRSTSTHQAGHLTRGSMALAVNVGLNALGGLAFWVVAARLHPESAVGGASALLQWTFLINLVTSMGLPVALARFAPDDSQRSARLFSFSLIYTFLTSFVGSGLLVLFAPEDVLEPLSSIGRLGAFVAVGVLVAGMSFAILSEVRLLALRWWLWVVMRVAVLVVVRLALVPLQPIDSASAWLYLLAIGAPAASGFVAAGSLLLSSRPHRLAPLSDASFVQFAATNWWVMIATQGLVFAVPAVVSLQVDNVDFASFYVVWSVAAIIFLVPQMIGQVLLTEGSKAHAKVWSQGRLALLLAGGFAMVATVVATLGRGSLSLVYGERYAGAEALLPILCAASIPWAVTATVISLLRIQRRQLALSLLAAGFALVTIPLAFIMTGRMGIAGGAWAWLLGHLVGAGLASYPLRQFVRANGSTGAKGQAAEKARSGAISS